MKLLLITFALVALAACQSFRPFAYDTNESSRWLEITGGEFWGSGRTVVTDTSLISEYYERVNYGRRKGEHRLKQQRITVLPPAQAKAFWHRVDELRLLAWSNRDIPPRTDYPSLTYRRDRRRIQLHSTPDSQSGGERFEALQAIIGKLSE